jgi:hypothetical protein
VGGVERGQRPEPVEAPGLADESVNSSRRAGPEPDPGGEAPADRAKSPTTVPKRKPGREGGDG